jgi:hypothetical protein
VVVGAFRPGVPGNANYIQTRFLHEWRRGRYMTNDSNMGTFLKRGGAGTVALVGVSVWTGMGLCRQQRAIGTRVLDPSSPHSIALDLFITRRLGSRTLLSSRSCPRSGSPASMTSHSGKLDYKARRDAAPRVPECSFTRAGRRRTVVSSRSDRFGCRSERSSLIPNQHGPRGHRPRWKPRPNPSMSYRSYRPGCLGCTRSTQREDSACAQALAPAHGRP